MTESCRSRISTQLEICKDLQSHDYDGVVLVDSAEPGSETQPEPFRTLLQNQAKIDDSLKNYGAVLPLSGAGQRLIYAPTGPLTEYDDVRSFGETACAGIKRALKVGVKNPLVILPTSSRFSSCDLVTLLGSLEALYVPIQLREFDPKKSIKAKRLGVWAKDIGRLENILPLAKAYENGRIVARDIGGGCPERMAPPRIEEYLKELFPSKETSNISMEVIKDENILKKEYPLFEAVNRGASVIPRHQGRIVYLTYEPSGPIKKTLFLVGKGVTYDTGGADIKYGGVMAGMSRDKCGAATVAGFMQILSILKPSGIKVIGALPIVRNSVGENCYVADELITSRSGLQVRIGNTDAEGRMIMADVLCKMKELAVNAVNPHLYTIATLTGHAVLAAGHGYTIIVDNAKAKKEKHSVQLQEIGEPLGDMFEISTLRREDLEFHKGKAEGDDIIQSNNLPSSRTPRGHQSPAAFLLMASGLDKHGLQEKIPLKYSHIDIAASSGDFPKEPTGASLIGLYKLHTSS